MKEKTTAERLIIEMQLPEILESIAATIRFTENLVPCHCCRSFASPEDAEEQGQITHETALDMEKYKKGYCTLLPGSSIIVDENGFCYRGEHPCE